MEGMGLKLTPVAVRRLLVLYACLDLWLTLLGLIASPNNPNKGFSPPPAAHLPFTIDLLMLATCDITVVVKKFV